MDQDRGKDRGANIEQEPRHAGVVEKGPQSCDRIGAEKKPQAKNDSKNSTPPATAYVNPGEAKNQNDYGVNTHSKAAEAKKAAPDNVPGVDKR
jgi:hypothetical protein